MIAFENSYDVFLDPVTVLDRLKGLLKEGPFLGLVVVPWVKLVNRFDDVAVVNGMVAVCWQAKGFVGYVVNKLSPSVIVPQFVSFVVVTVQEQVKIFRHRNPDYLHGSTPA